ncbi:MAG: hypothetical protein JNN07_19360 [Verrucomicrobiales bacterium]|nr:hypothetical protein [Verrucomicrobiales bacterium]
MTNADDLADARDFDECYQTTLNEFRSLMDWTEFRTAKAALSLTHLKVSQLLIVHSKERLLELAFMVDGVLRSEPGSMILIPQLEMAIQRGEVEHATTLGQVEHIDDFQECHVIYMPPFYLVAV